MKSNLVVSPAKLRRATQEPGEHLRGRSRGAFVVDSKRLRDADEGAPLESRLAAVAETIAASVTIASEWKLFAPGASGPTPAGASDEANLLPTRRSGRCEAGSTAPTKRPVRPIVQIAGPVGTVGISPKIDVQIHDPRPIPRDEEGRGDDGERAVEEHGHRSAPQRFRARQKGVDLLFGGVRRGRHPSRRRPGSWRSACPAPASAS